MSKVHIIHENPEWLPPLATALNDAGVPFEDWYLEGGSFDFSAAPPGGVFYNRMSASSHTRGHEFSPEYTASVLAWLGFHGRRVINDGRALELELSKVKQYAALAACGVRVPRTVVAVGRDAVRKAAHAFGAPLILKPNRGGKGAGVQLFQSLDALDGYLDSDAYDIGRDGTVLIQEYIQSADSSIIRNEFVNRQLVYAVRVDTSQGFELCPADVCAIEDLACPVGECPAAKFQILEGFTHPNHAKFTAFMAANGIEVAGIEMILDADGTAWTYDVNTNTNYNSDAEVAAGIAGTSKSGMGALARFLGGELRAQAAIRSAAE
ncbi:MAG: alpha-L-glutamate ligase [Proteobacteria bacterium]|nr:alpha-L-glutamate ligase [Pseudomonadota bacterium]